MFEELMELKYPKTRILRIPNGIKLKKYIDLDKNVHEGIIYGFVGRLSQFKNIRYMLGEFKDYFDKFSLDKLFIFGEGPELEYINNFIENNGLSNNIYLLGYEGNKEKIYSNLDVLIDPSHGQGISNANLEAMSTNTLLIASKVDGNIDLIGDGETGLLFEPKNKGALLEKLLYYKEYPIQAKVMTEKAQKLISETYDIKSISKNIIDFIFNRN
jgi:glycosyltransferase involved in cell wall biosynthesis